MKENYFWLSSFLLFVSFVVKTDLFFFVKTTAGEAVRFIACGKFLDELIDGAVHHGGQIVI